MRKNMLTHVRERLREKEGGLWGVGEEQRQREIKKSSFPTREGLHV